MNDVLLGGFVCGRGEFVVSCLGLGLVALFQSYQHLFAKRADTTLVGTIANSAGCGFADIFFCGTGVGHDVIGSRGDWSLPV